jgi:hypothetical protein
MKVKRIKCLACNTVLTADWEEGQTFSKCGCSNGTSIENYFKLSQPGTIVRALDKSKVEAQLLYDTEWGKAGDWWVLAEPEDENTPKFTMWMGKIEEGGFTGGLIVTFKTSPMTFNECRTYIKTNRVMTTDGRVYHLMKGLEDV